MLKYLLIFALGFIAGTNILMLYALSKMMDWYMKLKEKKADGHSVKGSIGSGLKFRYRKDAEALLFMIQEHINKNGYISASKIYEWIGQESDKHWAEWGFNSPNDVYLLPGKRNGFYILKFKPDEKITRMNNRVVKINFDGLKEGTNG